MVWLRRRLRARSTASHERCKACSRRKQASNTTVVPPLWKLLDRRDDFALRSHSRSRTNSQRASLAKKMPPQLSSRVSARASCGSTKLTSKTPGKGKACRAIIRSFLLRNMGRFASCNARSNQCGLVVGQCLLVVVRSRALAVFKRIRAGSVPQLTKRARREASRARGASRTSRVKLQQRVPEVVSPRLFAAWPMQTCGEASQRRCRIEACRRVADASPRSVPLCRFVEVPSPATPC